MKRYQNLLMMGAVILLLALPFWIVQKPAPGPEGKEVEIFRGSDDQAKDLIGKIAPGYQPWFKSINKLPSGDIGSLLLAIQAALGAGFIGYYLLTSLTRVRIQRKMKNEVKC
jgi:cobalt/nickel transport protein